MKDWGSAMAVATLMLLGGSIGYFIGVDSTRGPLDELPPVVSDGAVATASSFEVGPQPARIGTSPMVSASNDLNFRANGSTSVWTLDDDDVEVRTGLEAYRHDYCTLPSDPLAEYLECFGPRAFYRPYSWDSVTVVEAGER